MIEEVSPGLVRDHKKRAENLRAVRHCNPSQQGRIAVLQFHAWIQVWIPWSWNLAILSTACQSHRPAAIRANF